jgi:hypothetical protein
MKRDVTDFIAVFVVEADSDNASRMKYHAEAFRVNVCADPISFRRQVNAKDVKLLFSAFALEDKDFAVRYPTLEAY